MTLQFLNPPSAIQGFEFTDNAFPIGLWQVGVNKVGPSSGQVSLAYNTQSAIFGILAVGFFPYDAVILTQVVSLSVTDASQGYAGQSPDAIGVPTVFTPSFRTFRVPSERRSFAA